MGTILKEHDGWDLSAQVPRLERHRRSQVHWLLPQLLRRRLLPVGVHLHRQEQGPPLQSPLQVLARRLLPRGGHLHRQGQGPPLRFPLQVQSAHLRPRQGAPPRTLAQQEGPHPLLARAEVSMRFNESGYGLPLLSIGDAVLSSRLCLHHVGQE